LYKSKKSGGGREWANARTLLVAERNDGVSLYTIAEDSSKVELLARLSKGYLWYSWEPSTRLLHVIEVGRPGQIALRSYLFEGESRRPLEKLRMIVPLSETVRVGNKVDEDLSSWDWWAKTPLAFQLVQLRSEARCLCVQYPADTDSSEIRCSVFVLHRQQSIDVVIRLPRAASTWRRKVHFCALLDYCVVFVPGVCLRLIDCQQEHEFIESLQFSGSELLPPLRNSAEGLARPSPIEGDESDLAGGLLRTPKKSPKFALSPEAEELGRRRQQKTQHPPHLASFGWSQESLQEGDFDEQQSVLVLDRENGNAMELQLDEDALLDLITPMHTQELYRRMLHLAFVHACDFELAARMMTRFMQRSVLNYSAEGAEVVKEYLLGAPYLRMRDLQTHESILSELPISTILPPEQPGVCHTVLVTAYDKTAVILEPLRSFEELASSALLAQSFTPSKSPRPPRASPSAARATPSPSVADSYRQISPNSSALSPLVYSIDEINVEDMRSPESFGDEVKRWKGVFAEGTALSKDECGRSARNYVQSEREHISTLYQRFVESSWGAHQVVLRAQGEGGTTRVEQKERELRQDLLRVYQTLYCAFEELGTPFPIGFDEQFVWIAVQVLPRSTFLQQLQAGVLRLHQRFVTDLCAPHGFTNPQMQQQRRNTPAQANAKLARRNSLGVGSASAYNDEYDDSNGALTFLGFGRDCTLKFHLLTALERKEDYEPALDELISSSGGRRADATLQQYATERSLYTKPEVARALAGGSEMYSTDAGIDSSILSATFLEQMSERSLEKDGFLGTVFRPQAALLQAMQHQAMDQSLIEDVQDMYTGARTRREDGQQGGVSSVNRGIGIGKRGLLWSRQGTAGASDVYSLGMRQGNAYLEPPPSPFAPRQDFVGSGGGSGSVAAGTGRLGLGASAQSPQGAGLSTIAASSSSYGSPAGSGSPGAGFGARSTSSGASGSFGAASPGGSSGLIAGAASPGTSAQQAGQAYSYNQQQASSYASTQGSSYNTAQGSSFNSYSSPMGGAGSAGGGALYSAQSASSGGAGAGGMGLVLEDSQSGDGSHQMTQEEEAMLWTKPWHALPTTERECWSALGWTAASWATPDRSLWPQSDRIKWEFLPEKERRAAECLGFDEETWASDELEADPSQYARKWGNLAERERKLWAELGWSSSSWGASSSRAWPETERTTWAQVHQDYIRSPAVDFLK